MTGVPDPIAPLSNPFQRLKPTMDTFDAIYQRRPVKFFTPTTAPAALACNIASRLG